MNQLQHTDPATKEWRRLRSLELKESGWKQCEIAAALGVTCGAVSHWMKAVREGGREALYHRKAPGGKRKLPLAELSKLPSLLAQGAEAFGFQGNLWTTKRIAAVIEREFSVSLHFNHVGKLLKQLGWTPQKPKRRARQRDEQAIETWEAERWPEIKRGL